MTRLNSKLGHVHIKLYVFLECPNFLSLISRNQKNFQFDSLNLGNCACIFLGIFEIEYFIRKHVYFRLKTANNSKKKSKLIYTWNPQQRVNWNERAKIVWLWENFVFKISTWMRMSFGYMNLQFLTKPFRVI